MACPLCGEHCRCSATPAEDSHVSVLIDPEGYEDSEQQFASTINAASGDDTSLVHDLMMDLDEAPLGELGSTGTPIVTPLLGEMPVAASVTTTLIEAATTE